MAKIIRGIQNKLISMSEITLEQVNENIMSLKKELHEIKGMLEESNLELTSEVKAQIEKSRKRPVSEFKTQKEIEKKYL